MRIGFDRRTFVPAALVALWLAVTGLLLASGGNPEAYLPRVFGRSSRADAFEFLNRGLPIFWFMHSVLTLAAIAAARSGRTDVLIVLLIGPALALSLNLCIQEWADPNWYEFVMVDAIGWLVSAIVGCAYWRLRSIASP